MNNTNYRNAILSFFLALPILWGLSGNFLYEDAKLHWVSLTLFAAALSVFNKLTPSIQLLFKQPIAVITLCMAFFSIAMYYTHGYSSSLLRSILCVFVIIFITPQPLITKLLEHTPKLLFLSAAATFSFAVYHTYILGSGRWWSINPIPYTTFSCAVAAISIYLMFHQKSTTNKLLLLAATPLSLSTLFMGQTRGLWLALFISIILIFILLLKERRLNKWLFVFLATTILVVGFIGKEKIEQRIKATNYEVSQIAKGNLSTSIGLRLQMWKAGLELSRDHWLLGLGNDYTQSMQTLSKQDMITKRATQFTHFHNQFIDAVVKYGALGLVLILALFILPIYQAWAFPSLLANSVVILALVYFTAALTDVPLSHPQTLGAYLLLNYFVPLYKPEAKS